MVDENKSVPRRDLPSLTESQANNEGLRGQSNHRNTLIPLTEPRKKCCSLDSLYKASIVCRKGVMWKDSTVGFNASLIKNITRLKNELDSGKYKISPYLSFVIHEPKRRVIVSTRLRDRVVQRSLCDNYLYEAMTRRFINDNCACQLGKGTFYARDRLKIHLHEFYCSNGRNGYFLKCDIHDFFGSTTHKSAKDAIDRATDDPWVRKMVYMVIDSYPGEKGLGLGSQMTQLIELSVIDPIDHYVKEALRIRHYIRYMDDTIVISKSREELVKVKNVIEKMLADIGLTFSPKKTYIAPLSVPIKFLGFSFLLTNTGAVLTRPLPDKRWDEFRKISKMIKSGISDEKIAECLKSWESSVRYGKGYWMIKKTEDRIYETFRGK